MNVYKFIYDNYINNLELVVATAISEALGDFECGVTVTTLDPRGNPYTEDEVHAVIDYLEAEGFEVTYLEDACKLIIEWDI